jgi:hypothetical protein
LEKLHSCFWKADQDMTIHFHKSSEVQYTMQFFYVVIVQI